MEYYWLQALLLPILAAWLCSLHHHPVAVVVAMMMILILQPNSKLC
jgi:hypothetical protein